MAGKINVFIHQNIRQSHILMIFAVIQPMKLPLIGMRHWYMCSLDYKLVWSSNRPIHRTKESFSKEVNIPKHRHIIVFLVLGCCKKVHKTMFNVDTFPHGQPGAKRH